MHDMQSCGLDLHNAGFTIIPVEPNQKRVIIPNWGDTAHDIDLVTGWAKHKPFHSVGGLGRDTPFIDIDVTDPKISQSIYKLLLSILPTPPPVRTGKAPKLAIPCINPKGFTPFKKQKTPIYKNKEGILQAVEILGDGQMLVLAGIHPDTKRPYTWDKVPTIENIPTLTQRIIDTLFETFVKMAEAKVDKGEWVVHENSTTTIVAPAQLKKRKKSQTLYTSTEVEAILDEIPLQSHDAWYKLGMGLHHQFEGSDEGKELWKYYSRKYGEEYNEKEIDLRYPSFNKDPNSRGITFGSIKGLYNKTIAKKNESLTFELPDSTVKAPEGVEAFWYEGWFYVTGRHTFFRPISGELLKPEAFNLNFAGAMVISGEKGLATNLVTKQNLIPRVYATMYRPDTGSVGSYNGITYVNSYNVHIPEGDKPKLANMCSPTPIISYFTRLIPDQMERDLLMQYIAYIVQNPGKRINWAPVLLGVPGTGKTTIFELMKCILGGSNVKSVSAQQFTNKFNTFAEGSQFNFIEEIRMSGSNRFQAMDAVKELITNDNISVTPKGVNTYSVKNVTSYMLCTNHSDAVPIDEDDRRYSIFQTDLNTTMNQFDEIYSWIENRAHELKHWLENFPIPNSFNPKGHAPKTKSTMAMVFNTEDLLVTQIQNAIDDGTPLINSALISFSALRDKLIDLSNINDNTFSTKLRSKLLAMHYTKASQVRLGPSRTIMYKPTLNLHRKLKLADTSYEDALKVAKTYKH